MTLVICTLFFFKKQGARFFSGLQTDPGFQNKNSGYRLTGRLCTILLRNSLTHTLRTLSDGFLNLFQSFSKSLKKKLESALVPVTPKRLMSKRKPVIATPFSKKCLFYGGDVQKLIMSENDKGFPAWNGCKNILIFNPKVIRVCLAGYFQ